MTLSFAGDTNPVLKNLQNAKLGNLHFYMFDRARYRYLTAAKLIGIQTPLSAQLTEVNAFSVETLRSAYDTIATYFRFTHDNCQVPLPFSNQPYEEVLETAWSDFYYSEINDLVEMDDIALAILRAVCAEKTNAGEVASDYLVLALTEKYQARIEYLKNEAKKQIEMPPSQP